MIIGFKKLLAFEMVKTIDQNYSEVNIYQENTLLTDFDNTIYTSQFICSLDSDIKQISESQDKKTLNFMHYGPTTDSFYSSMEIGNETVKINTIFNATTKIKTIMDKKDVLSILANVKNILTKTRI